MAKCLPCAHEESTEHSHDSTVSRQPRPLTRITLCALLFALGSQASLSVKTASAAGSGSEAIQGLGSYFLTLPYGGIKMAVAALRAVAVGMGFIVTGGDNATADKIWGPAMGGRYVITPAAYPRREGFAFLGNCATQITPSRSLPRRSINHLNVSLLPIVEDIGGAFHQDWWFSTTGPQIPPARISLTH